MKRILPEENPYCPKCGQDIDSNLEPAPCSNCERCFWCCQCARCENCGERRFDEDAMCDLCGFCPDCCRCETYGKVRA